MESLTVAPITAVDGEVTIPGSKSLSNRILLLAALAKGETHITNLLDSDDIRHMLTALKQLGVSYELSADKTECKVTGLAGPINFAGSAELFLGNAGTAMRPLAAALCLGQGEFVLTGEPRMFERPIGHLVDALRQVGADIEYLKDTDFPPLKINATGLKGGRVEIKGSISSQFLTALLMAAPLAQQDLEIVVIDELVSKPYIEITLSLMKQFGVEVENQNYQVFKVKAGQTYQSPGRILVEGDASSASYFLAAAAIKGGTVKVNGVGTKSVQGDARFAEVLEQMGAIVEWGEEYISVTKNGPLRAVDVDLNHIPDAAMTIATAALFAEGTTAIRNIYNWRVKETDRLSAMAIELRKVGATVEEGEDYIIVTPPAEVQTAAIDTYNDHRMAMCFSLAAMGKNPMIINDPKCTAKTFPNYFELFESVVSH
ncbi:3-phosphoshikimate 1-carboxyvinyltransferase [Catenovulum agarivorans DS-2]|uniref:3-phosphoshikimate 1-carboxyvinyltransferase n=1 Tax=Catenovulum agarivorans DS-2 TaxID=1328313 RepID=W7QG98_9ALTE|nr:3-phosphoshikimate 1-carboxyvinyltransferase [Catenovulum agarivorans]EWH11959.1 3-phosphoshikimate 1-carboxyvinyltransferase [Catenovulum agarivorans DS-2]